MDQGLIERIARAEARRLLGAATSRLEHVQGVASAAERARGAVPAEHQGLLIAAAWLHDIGYAAGVVDTGFHPLDGARYLGSHGAPARLCCLVANHTHAWVEAEARGLADALAEEFPAERSPVADALTYADLTTGPDGETVTVEDRIAEILERYGPDHVVHKSIRQVATDLIAAVRSVEARRDDVAQPR